MLRKYIISLLIIISFFIAGCDMAGTSKSSEFFGSGQEAPVEDVNIHTGTEGLVFKWIEGAPPREVWENGEFSVLDEIRNKGTATIPYAKVELSGYNQQSIEVEGRTRVLENIEGKTAYNSEGGFIGPLFFDVRIIKMLFKTDYSEAFKLSACYDYITDATTDVCMNPNVGNFLKTGKDVCRVKDVTLSGGQGAPVAVTQVKQDIIKFGDEFKSEFRIYVKNLGEGQVTAEGKCQDNSLNKPRITASVSLGSENIDCDPDKIDPTKKGDSFIFCVADVDKAKGAYVSPLHIQLRYGYEVPREDYTKKYTKTIQIKKRPEGAEGACEVYGGNCVPYQWGVCSVLGGELPATCPKENERCCRYPLTENDCERSGEGGYGLECQPKANCAGEDYIYGKCPGTDRCCIECGYGDDNDAECRTDVATCNQFIGKGRGGCSEGGICCKKTTLCEANHAGDYTEDETPGKWTCKQGYNPENNNCEEIEDGQCPGDNTIKCCKVQSE